MKTAFAYLLVVPLASLCYTFGALLTAYLVDFVFAWLPTKYRQSMGGLLGGVCGVAVSVAFASFIFWLLLGDQSFTLAPFLASTLPLLVAVWNDWAKAAEIAPLEVGELSKLHHSTGLRSLATGGLIGIALAVAWFIKR